MFNPPIKPQEKIILSCTQEIAANPTIAQIQEACAKIRLEYPDASDSEISVDAIYNFDWVVELVSVNFYREVPNPKYSELMVKFEADMQNYTVQLAKVKELIKQSGALADEARRIKKEYKQLRSAERSEKRNA